MNTAAIVRDLPAEAIANIDGDSNYVHIQVLANAGALDRDEQLTVIARPTGIVAAAADDPLRIGCTRALRIEALEDGRGR